MSQVAATVAVLLTHPVGLHARPAVKLTRLAKRFAASIELARDAQGPWIDAKSIVRVMAAKLPQNATLHFRAQGDDAEAALAALSQLVRNDFTEDAGHDHAD
jgi:phosphocarrier protein